MFSELLALIMKFVGNIHHGIMQYLKPRITFLLLCLSLATFSSCMKRNIAGDYSAMIYEYPKGTSHTTYEKVERRVLTDSNGVRHMVTDTLYLHVVPDRMETTIRFYFHVDNKLNVMASYYEGPFTAPTTYFGKGKIKKDSLIVNFFYRETGENGLGGEVYDSLRYSPPLSLKFYRSKNLGNIYFEYHPSEQIVDSLDEYWSSYYSFNIQVE